MILPGCIDTGPQVNQSRNDDQYTTNKNDRYPMTNVLSNIKVKSKVFHYQSLRFMI